MDVKNDEASSRHDGTKGCSTTHFGRRRRKSGSPTQMTAGRIFTSTRRALASHSASPRRPASVTCDFVASADPTVDSSQENPTKLSRLALRLFESRHQKE